MTEWEAFIEKYGDVRHTGIGVALGGAKPAMGVIIAETSDGTRFWVRPEPAATRLGQIEEGLQWAAMAMAVPRSSLRMVDYYDGGRS